MMPPSLVKAHQPQARTAAAAAAAAAASSSKKPSTKAAKKAAKKQAKKQATQLESSSISRAAVSGSHKLVQERAQAFAGMVIGLACSKDALRSAVMDDCQLLNWLEVRSMLWYTSELFFALSLNLMFNTTVRIAAGTVQPCSMVQHCSMGGTCKSCVSCEIYRNINKTIWRMMWLNVLALKY
jgi:hypothetical protein